MKYWFGDSGSFVGRDASAHAYTSAVLDDLDISGKICMVQLVLPGESCTACMILRMFSQMLPV